MTPEEKATLLGDRPKSTWLNWTPEHVAMWNEWIAERPPVIREMVAKYGLRLDRLYQWKADENFQGRRVILHAFDEDGTVQVHILAQFNPDTMLGFGTLMDRTVFGIKPEQLEETEWEGRIEEVGEQ